MCPATGESFTLVLPKANTKATSCFLGEFAAKLVSQVHVLLVMDQAGRHGAKKLSLHKNVPPVSLPPYSPELNAIVEACGKEWNAFDADVARVRPLTLYNWITVRQSLGSLVSLASSRETKNQITATPVSKDRQSGSLTTSNANRWCFARNNFLIVPGQLASSESGGAQ